jgi:hypothetical protein
MTRTADQLRSIKNFDQLIPFLEEDLEWPFPHGRAQYDFEDLTFQYSAEEVGLESEYAAKIKSIHQLRPLVSGQPWGIFFVEFENKKLPIVVLRRILSHLVLKKRKSANPAERARWNAGDLIFISAFAEEGTLQREIAFAHFHQDPGDQPTLRVLGWDGGDTPLKLEHVAQILKQRLSWPADPANHDLWRRQWAGAFRYRIGQQIQTADLLARELARVARNIYDAAIALMKVESSRGPLRKMHEAFRTALIHDLKQEGFADTYAQTITYGLLTAAISRTDRSAGADGTFVLAEDIHNMVPITNPFLKEMLESFLKVGGRSSEGQSGLDFDELGVQEVVELLRSSEVDLPAVLEDFGNRNPGEDPVIRFYEDFLNAYNKKLKVQRGVFYTPQPVVSYIVRSVHEILQTEFGLADGLASTITWSEMAAQMADNGTHLSIPPGTAPDSPFVIILDPATGTATFLVEVIDVIYQSLQAKWKQSRLTQAQQDHAWNEYVPKHLLPRMFGYELMMAPYAIAHMKIGLKLHETGYRFGATERVRIYLTNALERPREAPAQSVLQGFVPALAAEAAAVNAVKRVVRFLVVIGNPPYASLSANLTPTLRAIVDPFRYVAGERIRERSMLQFEKNIQDDYIKFIAFSQAIIAATGLGVTSFITNHSYLDGPTLRGVRWNVLKSSDSVWLLDLHGNLDKAERSPTGENENVFDIKQGVAISCMLRKGRGTPEMVCRVSEAWGTRSSKYQMLSQQTLGSTPFQVIDPQAKYFYFVPPPKTPLEATWKTWAPCDEVFPQQTTGCETGFDKLMIGFNEDELLGRVKSFANLKSTKAAEEGGFSVGKGHAKKLFGIRDSLGRQTAKDIKPFQLRAYDMRSAFLRKKVLKTNSFGVLAHLSRESPALVTTRQTKEKFAAMAITGFCGHKLVSSYDRTYVFPLFKGESAFLGQGERVNLSDVALEAGASRLEVKFNEKSAPRIAIAMFDYTLAILNSPMYVTLFGELLQRDWPRIPLYCSVELFSSLAKLGTRLRRCHTLDFTPSPHLRAPELFGEASVERVGFDNGTAFLDTARTSGFSQIPANVWDFVVGGTRVCEQWLKDRKGRELSAEEIIHFGKIVMAISETIRITPEIDKVIEQHGGWPGAFAPSGE